MISLVFPGNRKERKSEVVGENRVDELARMLGGKTKSALEHAKELLRGAPAKIARKPKRRALCGLESFSENSEVRGADLALVGLRSRATGVACLETSFCCVNLEIILRDFSVDILRVRNLRAVFRRNLPISLATVCSARRYS